MAIKTVNGTLPDKYGKYAPEEFKLEGKPVCSLPIDLSELPSGTEDVAITFIDYDAVPVCGFPFIHWIACNFGPVTEIPEDSSRQNKDIIQGKNSLASKFYPDFSEALTEHYSGPMPPDKDHQYTLTVYALDEKLDLQNGFYLNEMYKAMKGHIIDQTEIDILAKA
ncbi:YbhB/YbcL family Raf kinase inhibitor-like protein [Fructobacillus sp. M2-14]|uniref:YbhB/YbcL family Raf kinase inhibitor-like protein n=1 Tax=Fructobacillus broussonetiae TaxID=2713173 RepID=A0ABS5QY96_9LACO|nr:YbhB/YbcL family Raf kinase inhibitor-like protein [Fructobacillus broussonetiae]MBS9338081.1 YbhB/YbcL family Raf kinase inhibitor-like protein [Fructobacillus broussonetiae]